MADLNLTRFDAHGLELFVDQNTGRAYASQSATARMCSKGESTIRQWITSQSIEVLEAEILTTTGLKTSQLLPAESVFKAALKYCPELAEKMGAAGANVYMCGVAGYKVAVTTNEDLQRLERQFLPTPSIKLIKEAAKLYKGIYGAAYEARYVADKLKQFYPELAGEQPQPEEKPSLPPAALLTPTQIAAELGVAYKTGAPNPQWVNKKLEELGYQVKVAGQWSATEKAAGLADRKPVETESRTQKDQLLWSDKIIPVLQEHVAVIP
jgi:hypothetical protein